MPALDLAANAARAIARQGQDRSVQAWSRSHVAPLYSADDPTTSIDDTQKTALLSEIDVATRDMDPRVKQVIVSLASSQVLILVLASYGTIAAELRALVGLGAIYLRLDDERAALDAFERALAINPHLSSTRQLAEELRRRLEGRRT